MMPQSPNSPARPPLDPDRQREFAVEIVRRLKEAGFTALWAGGCVRDHLLGKTPMDYDVATNATPKQVRKLFRGLKTLDVGANFGVVIVVARDKAAGEVEVATFRSDGPYSDGRRPDSVTFCSPEEDAQRRDFTINGMFFDPLEHKVLDFVGGERDLSQGYIRAIGDPHDRMHEDKLRMLRAVRFAAHLEFGIARATKAAIIEMAPRIHAVSAERIAAELRRMLTDRHRHVAIELAHELGLLREILPEACSECRVPSAELSASDSQLSTLDARLSALRLLQEPSFELAFAVLLLNVDNIEAICRRLKLSNDELDKTSWLVRQQHALRHPEQLSLARLKRLLAHPFRDDLLALTRAYLLATDADLQPVLFCERFLEATPPEVLDPPPLITGNDLIALGLKPGPRFKKLIDETRDAQLNGDLTTRDAALAWLKARTIAPEVTH
jgi:poly(A) polymerase